MANNKEVVSTLVAALRTNLSAEGVNNRKEITGLKLSSESMDSGTKESATEALTTLNDTIDSTLALVVSNEEFGVDFTPAQINAAKSIASLAIDPVAAVSSLKNLKEPAAFGTIHRNDSVELGVEDVIDAAALSTESFDGQAINNALYFSIAYNLMSANQDAFGEAFYPTIAIDPTASGLSVEVEFTSLMNEIKRGIDGSGDASKYNKIPLVKAIYDENVFGVDKNRVVPVKRAENATVFVPGIEFVNTESGEDITTGPLVFGKTIGLLGISQTDAMLAKGSMDNTDSLDRTLNLNRVYYDLTGTDGSGNDITESFYIDAGVIPHANFTYSTQYHNKDLSLSLITEAITINTSTTKTATGAASVILAQLPAGYSIRFKTVITGQGNTSYGDVGVYVNEISMVEITDANGDKVPSTASEYTTIKTVTDSIKGTGYTLDAFRTNSNLRTRGQLVTSDRYTELYSVPLRSGITVLTSVNDATGTDNDSKLTTQVQTAGMRISLHAVKSLIATADNLHNLSANGGINNSDVPGVGKYFLDTYGHEDSVDLGSFVDSLSSADRAEDIKSALVNKLKDEALKMYIGSNYIVAYQAMRGAVGGKPTLIIGTNPRIKQYLTSGDGKVNLGDDFDVVIVSTPNKTIGNKIYMTFGIFDANRNTEVNPLNFGQCAYAPTISTDVVRTMNGATIREVTTVPRFLHINNLQILSVVEVTGIATVLGKVTRNMHTL